MDGYIIEGGGRQTGREGREPRARDDGREELEGIDRQKKEPTGVREGEGVHLPTLTWYSRYRVEQKKGRYDMLRAG